LFLVLIFNEIVGGGVEGRVFDQRQFLHWRFFYLPDSDYVIGVTSIQSGTVWAPSKRKAFRSIFSWILNMKWESIRSSSRIKVGNNGMSLKIPDFDRVLSTSAQPVVVWTKCKGMNDGTSIQSEEGFAFRKLPKMSNSIFTTRSTKGTIR
jgi:hypothetical protein